MSRLSRTAAFIYFASLISARAVLVDWSTLTWTPGTLSNSYDVDPAFAGNDVTVTVSGDTGQLQPSLPAPNPQTPAITPAFDGGLSPGHPTLELALNLANSAQSVTVTISFANAGVNHVSFNLFDIDFSNATNNTYQDVISSITATSAASGTVTPNITNVGANVTLSGSGANQILTGMISTVDKGAGSDLGNATITFDGNDITSITFNYSSGSMFVDPTYQHIGIDNLDYTIVPETNPAWLSLGLCGSAVVLSTWRRWIRRQREIESV